MGEFPDSAVNTTQTHAGHRLLALWIGLVQRSAAAILVLAVLATIGAAYVTVTRIGINTNTTDMLSEELPFRRNEAALGDAFPQFTDNFSIVIDAASPDLAGDSARLLAKELRARPELFRDVFYPEGHPFFRAHGLLYLDLDELHRLADRLAEAQPMLSVLSGDLSLRGLAQVLRLALDGGALDDVVGITEEEAVGAVAPALDKIAAAVESVAAEQAGGGTARPLPWSALLSGETPGPEDKRRFIVVQPVLDFDSLEPAAKAIEEVRRLAGELGLTGDNGVRVRMTGTAVMFQDELRSVRDGMGVVGLISVALVIGLLAFGLRSIFMVAATLVTLFTGLVWTAFFATVVVGELNLISVAFAVLFIGLSVDFGIHFALRFQEAEGHVADASGQGDALREAAQGVGGPLFLCAAAAATGFFAFLPTSYNGLSELGLISGVGMFIALFANLTVLPAILRFAPPHARSAVFAHPGRERVERIVMHHPRVVIVGALVMGVVAAGLTTRAWFDDDPFNLRDPESESVATLLDLLGDSRVEPYSAEILAGDLATAERLALDLERLPEVDSALTLGDFVPQAQEDKLAVIDEMAFFLTPVLRPQARVEPPSFDEQRAAIEALRRGLDGVEGPLAVGAARLASAFDRLELSDAALASLNRVLLGGLPARLRALDEALEAEAITPDDLPVQVRERNLAADGRAKIEVIPRENLHDADARSRFVDAVLAVAPGAAGAPVTITGAGRAVVQALGEAAVYAVVLVTMLLLVVLRSVRDSLMILAPLILAALLTVAATVVLGIPFNFANVIVLPLLFGLGVAGGIHIMLRAREAGSFKVLTTSTPRAVVFSALTTIGSFWALALSSHRGMASMGVLLTIAISFSMLCTLVVLPALLQASGVPPRVSPAPH